VPVDVQNVRLNVKHFKNEGLDNRINGIKELVQAEKFKDEYVKMCKEIIESAKKSLYFF
jgi:hypothetical protein